MRIIIAAIGREKPGPERELIRHYLRPLPWQVECKSLEVKKNLPTDKRKAEETQLLISACAGINQLIALDERGAQWPSQIFATKLGQWRDAAQSIGFIIGGADGLDRTQLTMPHQLLALGEMTWPHMLVRVMLAEQLFRAHSLLTNHPYHRA